MNEDLDDRPELTEAGPLQYCWNPACHGWFEESCTIYFLDPKQPYEISVELLRQLCEELLFRSFRIYPLYGRFDFLVICWGASQKHTYLKSSFKRLVSPNEILEVRPSNFLIIQNGAQVQSPQGEGWDHEIKLMYCSKGDQAFFFEKQQLFLSSGLLYKVGPESGNQKKYKCFILFRNGNTPAQQQNILPMTSLGEQIRKISSNNHDCNFWLFQNQEGQSCLELSSDSFDKVYHLLAEISSGLTDMNLDTETLFVASSKGVERDDIDTFWEGLNIKEVRMLGFLELDHGFRDYASLDKESQRDVLEIFNLYSPFLCSRATFYSHFEPIFRDLLRARITSDNTFLIKALPFLHTLEGYFLSILISTWKDIFGDKEWFAKVKKEFSEKTGQEFDYDKVTLQHAIIFSAKDQSIRLLLDKKFEKDWAKRLGSIVEIRNDFSHGRIAIDPSFSLHKWMLMSKKICDSGIFYNQVVDEYNNIARKRGVDASCQ